MRLPRVRHRWNLSPKAAIALQTRLASRVIEAPLEGFPRYVAGLDAAFSPDGHHCLAAAVVWDSLTRQLIEQKTACRPVRFPYIPGLLSFREAPALLAAMRKLEQVPEVLICDGQGRAHPRRFGIACHLGLLSDLPALGCAKSLLVGKELPLGLARGSLAPLMIGPELVGYSLRSRDGSRPLYISVGHKIQIEPACKIVLECCMGHRLPEPTRLADLAVARMRREWSAGNAGYGQDRP